MVDKQMVQRTQGCLLNNNKKREQQKLQCDSRRVAIFFFLSIWKCIYFFNFTMLRSVCVSDVFYVFCATAFQMRIRESKQQCLTDDDLYSAEF